MFVFGVRALSSVCFVVVFAGIFRLPDVSPVVVRVSIEIVGCFVLFFCFLVLNMYKKKILKKSQNMVNLYTAKVKAGNGAQRLHY